MTDLGILLNEVFKNSMLFFLENLFSFENFYLGLSKLGHTNSTPLNPHP